MRILLLNQAFYPDVAATAQHAHDLARHLVAEGHEVCVIASRSIYGQRGGKLPRRETIDGIEVHRVGVSLFGKSHLLLRLIDFALFYLLALIKALTIRRPDVSVCFTTPPMIALIGYLLRLVKGSRFVYWVMDLYPDVLIACDVLPERSLRARVLEVINRFCIRRSDRAVVLGRCMKQRLLDKGLPDSKLTIIRVWADTEEIAPLPVTENSYRQQWSLQDRFVVMYSGNFGLAHDVATMCEAAKWLQHRQDIRFVFVGGGKRKQTVDDYLARHELPNAQSHPYQPREKLGPLLSLADVHLVTMIASLAGVLVPSKAFGVMATGRPMLFIGPATSEVGQLIAEHDCGRIIPIGDSEALAAVIEQLAEDRDLARQMGERARTAMQHRYDRRHACRAWEQLLREVTAEAAGNTTGAPRRT